MLSGFTAVIATGLTVCIMFLHGLQRSAGTQLSISSLTKKSLFFFRGQYDIAQHTKVIWNWEEPQVVGKTMTFSIRVRYM